MELIEYIHRGGIIVYILIGFNILGFTLILWKSLQYFVINFQKNKIAQSVLNTLKNSNDAFQEKTFQNAITKQINKLERGLNTIKIIASISPLLGLLGTVIGVLNSFDSIAKSGLGDPNIFSNGISIALITTVAGLIVAIPHYIAYNYFVGYLDNLEHNIEERVISKL